MITREPEPCWLVTCDACGEKLGSEEVGWLHFEKHEEAVEACANYDWRIRRDDDGLITGTICSTCAEEGADIG